MKLALATLFVASATLCLGCGGASSWVPPELRSDAQWWIEPGLPQSVLGAPWDGALARVDVGALTADPTCRVEESPATDTAFPIEDTRYPERWSVPAGSQVTLQASRRLRVEGCAGAEGALQLVELYAGAVVVTAPGAERQRAPDAEGVLVHAGWEWHVSGWRPGEAIVAARFAPSPRRPVARCDGRAWADAVEPWLDAASAAALLSPTPAAEAQTLRDALGETLAPLLSGECTDGPDASARAWLQRQSDTPPAGELASVASAWVAHALEAHDAGRYVDAIEALDHALDRKPDHAAALLLRARLVRDVSGRLEAAHDALDAAPEGVWSAVVAYERGLTSLQAGASGLAVEALADAAERDARYVEPRMALGALAWSEGDTERARAHFEEVLAIDPQHAGARSNLGVYAEVVAERPLEAAALYEEALAADPEHVDTLLNYARLRLRAVGGLSEAQAMLSRAAALAPQDREVLAELEALATRPDMTFALLDGAWRASAFDVDGVPVAYVANWDAGHGRIVVERGGELTATELTLNAISRNGPELAVSTDVSRDTPSAIFEAIDEDRVVFYRLDDPVETRIEWHRWAADGPGI